MINRSYTSYLYLKVKCNLKSEASKNYLSYFWWVVEPILMISVFYFVFSALLGRGEGPFIYQLTVGVVFWLWFSNIVSHSVLSILGAGPLITQVYFPKSILPLIVVLVDTFKQSIVILVLLTFIGLAHGVSSTWLALPILLVIQFIVNFAASLIVAALTPFIPDLRFLVDIGLSMMMFCSGVFYNLDLISEQYRELFLLNPMANLISQYRAVLLQDSWPQWSSLFAIAVVCGLLIFLVSKFIKKNDRLYPRLAIQ